MEQQRLNFREQLVRARVAKAIRAGLDAIDRKRKVAKSSGVGKPAGDGPDARAEAARARNIRFWPRTNREMLAGSPITSVVRQEPAQGATVRKIDAALDRIAAAKERREAEPTRFAFIPRYGMVIKFKSPVDGGTEYARVSDWGAQGLTAWTKEHGEVKVAWRDARAATERELEARRQAEDDWHEAQGANTSRWAAEDMRPGLRVTAIDGDLAGGGEEVRGTIEAVMPDRGGYVVLRAQGGLRAFRVSDVVMIHDAPVEKVAKSRTTIIDILDDDEPDEVDE